MKIFLSLALSLFVLPATAVDEFSTMASLSGKSYAVHKDIPGHHMKGWAFFFNGDKYTHMRIRIPKDPLEKIIYYKQYTGTYRIEGSRVIFNHETTTCKTGMRESATILAPVPDDYFSLVLDGEPSLTVTFRNTEKFESPVTNFGKDAVLIEDKNCNIVN